MRLGIKLLGSNHCPAWSRDPNRCKGLEPPTHQQSEEQRFERERIWSALRDCALERTLGLGMRAGLQNCVQGANQVIALSDVTDVAPHSAITHAGKPDGRKRNNRSRLRVERKLGNHKGYTDHVPRKVGMIVVCRH